MKYLVFTEETKEKILQIRSNKLDVKSSDINPILIKNEKYILPESILNDNNLKDIHKEIKELISLNEIIIREVEKNELLLIRE